MPHDAIRSEDYLITKPENEELVEFEYNSSSIDEFLKAFSTFAEIHADSPTHLSLGCIFNFMRKGSEEDEDKISEAITTFINIAKSLKKITSLRIDIDINEYTDRKELDSIKMIIESQSELKYLGVNIETDQSSDIFYDVYNFMIFLSKSNNPIKELKIDAFIEDSDVKNDADYHEKIKQLFISISNMKSLEKLHFPTMEHFFYFEFLFTYVTTLKILSIGHFDNLTFDLYNYKENRTKRLDIYKELINNFIIHDVMSSHLESFDIGLTLTTKPNDELEKFIYEPSSENLEIKLEYEYLFNMINIVLSANKKIKSFINTLNADEIHFNTANNHLIEFNKIKNDFLQSIKNESDRFKNVLLMIFNFKHRNWSSYNYDLFSETIILIKHLEPVVEKFLINPFLSLVLKNFMETMLQSLTQSNIEKNELDEILQKFKSISVNNNSLSASNNHTAKRMMDPDTLQTDKSNFEEMGLFAPGSKKVKNDEDDDLNVSKATTVSEIPRSPGKSQK